MNLYDPMDRYGLTLVSAAAAEPITRAEAKLHAKIDTTADDLLVDGLIASARAHVEMFCGVALVTQTWDWTIDRFPSGDSPLWAPKAPLQSVTSITYTDTAGDSQTFASSKYVADSKGIVGRIALAYGEIWPTTIYEANAVTVRIVCGFGAASAVPNDFKQAIYFMVADWYRNRESNIVGTIVATLPRGVDNLLWSLRRRGAA